MSNRTVGVSSALRTTLCFVVALTFATPGLRAFAQEVKKVALLIGNEVYEKKGFSNLNYAEDDMTSLGAKLREQGFEVTILLGSSAGKAKANRQNIVDAINKEFVPKLKTLNKDDIALVAVAGHGRHAKASSGGNTSEDHFYCPCDAHDSDSASWISISTLITSIEANSGSERNLILVDACRDNPSRGRGVDGKGFSLNRDAVAVMFASSYNEQAYEPDKLSHGLFTYYVLEALAGAAKNFDNEVTWDSLVDYVKGRVETESYRLKKESVIAGTQRPNSIGNLRGKSPVLAKVGKSLSRPPVWKAPFSESEASDRADQWAKFLKVGRTHTSPTADIEMTLIPPGEYLMGNEESVDAIMAAFSNLQGLKREFHTDAEHQHRVAISRPFWLGRTEITLGQFKKFVKDQAYKTEAERDGKGGWGYDSASKKMVDGKPEFIWKNNGFTQSDNHPVVNVSWNDAVEFCNWLSRKEGRTECYRKQGESYEAVSGTGYRLPTEAEWEYACRAGTTGRYYHGYDPEKLVQVGNVWDASTSEPLPDYGNRLAASDRFPFSAPVGRFRSNNFGLLDMHGNVFEWCQDWYDADYYQVSRTTDPSGPATGSVRVNRGGCWFNDASICRSAFRDGVAPEFRGNPLGFRVALVPSVQ